MKTAKFRQLTEIHLRHRIWRNELEGILQEIYFWEDLLDALSEGLNSNLTDTETWKDEITQLHHFRQIGQKLLDEIRMADSQVSAGVRTSHVLDAVTQQDHQYLRTKMGSFQVEFRSFKAQMQQYMLTPPTF